jgi:hypothetical protein
MRATSAIVGELTGHRVSTPALAYLGNCIGLGSKDAIFQRVDGEGRSTTSLRGWPAATVKAFVLRGTAWNMHNPTYGLPTRRRRVSVERSPRVTA